MADLKPCPFCGGEAHLDREEIFCHCGAKMPIDLYSIGAVADDRFPTYAEAKAEMIEAWNRRTIIETHFYDKEETYPNCTVQVLTNTVTGDVSVGWWKNGGNEDDHV